MGTALTKRRLEAIQEALTARLAGPLESDRPSQKDYEAALQWVWERIAKSARKGERMPWCKHCSSYHHPTAPHATIG